MVVLQCGRIPPAATQSLRKGLQETANLELQFVANHEDRPVVEELASSVLVQLLSANAAPERYLLIVDGLDENRIFATLPGLQSLVNQFADLECGVVLTARTEHFSSLFGNYSAALSQLSWKYGKAQDIALLQLQPWSRADVLGFIDRVVTDAGPEPARRILALRHLLSTDGGWEKYGDIPTNPLFLRFLIDDVVEEGLQTRSRASLLHAWARRKFWRDAQKRADTIPPGQDLLAFVDRVYAATESIAGMMTTVDETAYQLVETITEDRVSRIIESLAADGVDPVLSLLLHSVMMPIKRRSGQRLELAFSFRIFQEFFLASWLNRERRDSVGFPRPVRDLCEELSALHDERS